ncbi:von Willebrand factor type A domain containing protein [Acanthamoeba castellanii str. Neff]|uniref:von Willebrand factor type A domain containing protein n=1 Tax=Acanthamoeba castellanii (strain ATCC 30010 / Neff) TaxID=1257118 RepID=L8HA47_ACACF|nr:von Willebrand factor type A domain containing protein [Acanthamoeba castellanii str. Neff]ELR22414.1 von Willebrand factor type A domain containing protein [Acanthamoeba castellanii str. Neff]
MSAAQQQHVVQFQSITGLAEADCRQRLQTFNWNVEAALDAYFNSNVAPPAVFTPPPAAVSQVPLVPILAHAVPIPPLRADDTFLCGLFPKTAGKGLPASVPLRGLAVKAEVVGMVAQVEVTQRYVNAESAPIEAVFKFRQEECSIYGFEAIVDGEKVVGEIKEKEEALNTYDDAISSGGRGFLLAQDDKVKGAFSLSVGNLPPGKECVVTFRYVSELAVEGDFVRVALPITRLPIHGSDSTTTADTDDATVKDGLHVTISADMPSPVPAIECPSGHELSTTTNANTAQVQFDSAKHVSSTGLVRQSIGEPQAVVEVDKAAGSAVAMVSFVPQLENLRDADVIAEVIFVVDRSGSMSGSRINQAKNALALFLHSLPIGTRFNVIGFGSRYEKLFPTSRAYDDSSLEIANRHASGISADLGGTELLAPLRDVLSSPADPQFPRQVFVLTDGEVGNTEDVVSCVRKHAKGTRVFTLGIGSDASTELGTRVFTLGIGSDASTELVNGIANAGKGHAEFVVSGERLEAKVLRQLKRALQPVLKQPTIDYAAGGVAVKSHTPNPLPAVFEGERVIAYAFFDTTDTDLIEKAMAGAVLRARTDVEESEKVEFKINAQSSIKEGQLLHRLAARSLIKDLEEAGAEANKGAITELALRYGLVSPFTSFVASADGAKLAQIQQQVDEVKHMMQCNIAQVLERGEKLEDLQVHTEALESGAMQFRRSASSMKSGGILSSISNAFSSVLGRGSAGPARNQSGAANPDESFDADFTSDGNQIDSILSRRRAVASDNDDEESEDWSDGSCGDSEKELKAEREKKKAEKADKKKKKKAKSSRSKKNKHATASASTTTFCGAAEAEQLMGNCFDDFSAAEPLSAPLSADPFAGFTFQSAAPAPAPVMQASASASSSALDCLSLPIGRWAAPAAHMRPLDRFVHHQKANGRSWELNENLAQALGRGLAELVASVPADVSADLWATALALTALDSQFAAEKEEWELLAGKARRWLARELKKAATSVDALLAAASAFLQA